MLTRITTGCIIEVVNLEQILRKNGLQCHYLKAKNNAVFIIWITQLCMCKILQIRHIEGAYCVCIFYHVVYHYQASRNKNCFKFRGRVLWVYHDSVSFLSSKWEKNLLSQIPKSIPWQASILFTNSYAKEGRKLVFFLYCLLNWLNVGFAKVVLNCLKLSFDCSALP